MAEASTNPWLHLFAMRSTRASIVHGIALLIELASKHVEASAVADWTMEGRLERETRTRDTYCQEETAHSTIHVPSGVQVTPQTFTTLTVGFASTGGVART